MWHPHHQNRFMARFTSHEEGGVFIFIGFVFLVLIMAVGAAIDMGRAFMVQSRALSSLDSAVLAAGTEASASTPEELVALAENYFEANFPEGYMGSTATNLTVAFDQNTQKLLGTVDLSVPMIFGSFLGLDALAIGAATEVTRVGTDTTVEIAMALDYTPSMCFKEEEPNKGQYDPDCTKYLSMVSGVRDDLIGTIDLVTGKLGTVYYAAVPFEGGAFLPNGDILGRATDPGGFEPKTPEAISLTSEGQHIVDMLEGGKPDPYGETFTHVGTAGGWMALRPDDKSKFNHELSTLPGDFDNVDNLKILILLTDGDNKMDMNADGEMENFPLADDTQKEMCEDIKNQRIIIFSIVYGEEPTEKIKEIFKDCATPPWKEHYFEPMSGGEIKLAFKKIADSIINLRITK